MRGCFAGAAVCLLLLIARPFAADEPRSSTAQADSPTSISPHSGDPPAANVEAGKAQSSDPQSSNAQSQAEALLERARHLSDIRGPDAPSFRLKATFWFVGDELETFEGTYTEFWISDSKWRREIVIGGRKKTEIGSDRKIWEIESGPTLPEKASRVEFAAGIFPARTAQLEFESVDSVPGEQGTKCAVTRPAGSSQAKSALCFDQASGVLVEYIVPQWTRYHLTDFSCEYGEFQKFGSQWFPYAMTCRQGGHRQMEVHVAELAAETFNDAELFEPPANGAVELGRCMAGEVAAKADYTPAPLQPAGIRNRNSSVTLRLVVDVKGKPRDIQVVRPAGKALDEMAVGTVGRWRFKPATCNGEPMAQRIEFEVAFRSY